MAVSSFGAKYRGADDVNTKLTLQLTGYLDKCHGAQLELARGETQETREGCPEGARNDNLMYTRQLSRH